MPHALQRAGTGQWTHWRTCAEGQDNIERREKRERGREDYAERCKKKRRVAISWREIDDPGLVWLTVQNECGEEFVTKRSDGRCGFRVWLGDSERLSLLSAVEWLLGGRIMRLVSETLRATLTVNENLFPRNPSHPREVCCGKPLSEE